MFEFANIFLQKRRSVIVAIVAPLLLISLLASVLQAHQTSIAAQVQALSYADQGSQGTYDSTNTVTNALSQMADDVGGALDIVKARTLNSIMLAASGITRFEKDIAQGGLIATVFTFRGADIVAVSTVRAIGGGFAFAGHIVGDVHRVGDVFGSFSGLTHVSALIRPQNHTPTPTITEIRIQQAAIIQIGTENVSATPISNGAGGACDSGEGNGGYPMSWCNTPMDSISTVSYSSDPINRECTSYAFWYFTSVEGHTTFRATGNAKYWAATSNYPTHTVPAIGAIAVETAGAYGHVAIVQALPGQQYAGQAVPAGYVLVSEMNYDWHGHFRYSYSPLSKFTSYIYP